MRLTIYFELAKNTFHSLSLSLNPLHQILDLQVIWEHLRERVKSVLGKLKVNGQPSPVGRRRLYIVGVEKVTV